MNDEELEAAMPIDDVKEALCAEPDAIGWNFNGARVPVAQAIASRCNMVDLRSLRKAAVMTSTSIEDLSIAVKLNDIGGDPGPLDAILNPGQ